MVWTSRMRMHANQHTFTGIIYLFQSTVSIASFVVISDLHVYTAGHHIITSTLSRELFVALWTLYTIAEANVCGVRARRRWTSEL